MELIIVILGIFTFINMAVGGCVDNCNSECSTYRCRKICYSECQTPCNSCCDQPTCATNNCGSSPCNKKEEYVSHVVHNPQQPSHSNITLTLNNNINTVNKIDNPINVTTINVNNINFLEQNDTICCNIAVPRDCGHDNCDVEIVYTCSEECRNQQEPPPIYQTMPPPVYDPPPVYHQPPMYQPPSVYQPPQVYQPPPVYQPPSQPVYIPQPMPYPGYIPQSSYTPVQQPCTQAPAPCPYG